MQLVACSALAHILLTLICTVVQYSCKLQTEHSSVWTTAACAVLEILYTMWQECLLHLHVRRSSSIIRTMHQFGSESFSELRQPFGL